ncbi:helix-turn-helix domain-containing protein [Pontibacter sp. H249]|uniref:helix-turn-helix domain-containing protein n=1 Tax=Pontibacter sp. H249 TaxID=3133420 RepID=UPI0030C3D544
MDHDEELNKREKLITSEELKKIGAKLTRLRKERGYTNSDSFSYDNNINRSQYGKYEAGSEDMRISSLVKVLNIYGLTLEDFFGKDYT